MQYGDVRETVISTVNLSGGSHSMLPNQCRPYGRQKVRHHKQTNKEVCTNIMINWWLSPSQHPATTSWIDLLMASLCGSTEKKSAGKDLRGQASYDPKYDTHHFKKKVAAKVLLAQELKLWFIMIMTEPISPPAFWKYNEDNATASKLDLFFT